MELAVAHGSEGAETPGYPGAGTLLGRLSQHRGLDLEALAQAAQVPEADLGAIADTARPDPALLRRLAPPLGLHTADLFLIAGLDVPGDLAPLDARAGRMVPSLIRDAGGLPPQHRAALRRHVRSLPQEQARPDSQLRPHRHPWRGYGTLIVDMFHHRNLTLLSTVNVLAHMTDLWLSASTIGLVRAGRAELTPHLLARFAIVLGIPGADLAALTGLPPLDHTPPHHPAAADMAGLIWELRRLTADQIQQVHARVATLLLQAETDPAAEPPHEPHTR